MEDSSYEPDQGWQEQGNTYLNSSLQDTVWLKQPAGNLLHTTFEDSHGQKKKMTILCLMIVNNMKGLMGEHYTQKSLYFCWLMVSVLSNSLTWL